MSRRAIPAVAVAATTFLVFLWAPNRQVGDSQYTILLAHSVVTHREPFLDRYGLDPSDRHFERIKGHLYYAYPAGSAILSTPFVAAMEMIAHSPVKADGRYDRDSEAQLDVMLAHLLMGAFVGLVFLTSATLLPIGPSLLIALTTAFGTQVFSSMSRALWSDTWGTLLLGIATLILMRAEVSQARVHGTVLGLLASAAYIVRPTNAIALLVLGIFIFAFHRRSFVRFVVGAIPLLVLFVGYSLRYFGSVLPSYHLGAAVRSGSMPRTLAANLISPSRGLFVCVPVIIGIAIVLVGSWRKVRFRRVAWLAIAISALYIVGISRFNTTGGHCFGARLTAGLVPWFVLLMILALDAVRARGHPGDSPRLSPRIGRTLALAVAGGLTAASIFINAMGAASPSTARWNVMPLNIDDRPERQWDWHRPQFAAPFVRPQGPFPILDDDGLALGSTDADRYVGWDWSYGEGESRWTDGRTDTFRFSLPVLGQGRLAIDARPFLSAGKVDQQRVRISLNGHVVGDLTYRHPAFSSTEIAVAAQYTAGHNTVRFELPDAVSPRSLQMGSDRRRLAIAIRRIRWIPTPAR